MAKKSVIVQYTIGYLSLFLLIFIFGSILINQMFSFMEEELKDSTALQLKQIVDNLEDNLNDFSEVSNRICVDSKLQKEVFLNQGNSALNGIKQLQNYKYTMKLVDMLFLCYNEDEIYTTDGKSTAATLANGTLKLTEESSSLLKTALLERENNLRTVLMNTQGTMDLLYLFPVPASQKVGDGVVGFIIKENNIQKELSQALRSYDSFALMVLDTGEVVAQIDNTNNLADEEKQTIYSSMIMGQNTEKLGYTSIRCESSLMGFSLSIAINTNQVLNRAIKMQWMITAFGAILFVLSIAALFFINQFNYKPIQSLRRLAESQGVHPNLKGNELDAVRRVMEQSFQEQKQKDINLLKFDATMKNQIVFILFGGIIQDDNRLKQIVETYHVELNGPFYSVIGILIDSNSEQLNLCLSEIPAFCIFNTTRNNDKILVSILVSLPDKDANSVGRVNIAKQLREMLKNTDLSCSALTCGMVYGRLSEIHHSYKEMVSATEICCANLSHSQSAICSFESLAKVSNYKYYFSSGQMEKLKAELENLDKDKTVEAFQAMLRCLDRPNITMEVRRFHYYAIVQNVIEQVQKMDVSEKQMERLFAISTMETQAFESGMMSYIDRFIAEKQPRKDCIDEILKYMDENFFDSNMSLEQLAGVFHMTSGNVSKYIKNKTGQSYSYYLSHLRMEEACRLLRETNIDIQTLILQVGYFDPTSFTKKFKLLYNMTPGEYRDYFTKNFNK